MPLVTGRLDHPDLDTLPGILDDGVIPAESTDEIGRIRQSIQVFRREGHVRSDNSCERVFGQR